MPAPPFAHVETGNGSLSLVFELWADRVDFFFVAIAQADSRESRNFLFQGHPEHLSFLVAAFASPRNPVLRERLTQDLPSRTKDGQVRCSFMKEDPFGTPDLVYAGCCNVPRSLPEDQLCGGLPLIPWRVSSAKL